MPRSPAGPAPPRKAASIPPSTTVTTTTTTEAAAAQVPVPGSSNNNNNIVSYDTHAEKVGDRVRAAFVLPQLRSSSSSSSSSLFTDRIRPVPGRTAEGSTSKVGGSHPQTREDAQAVTPAATRSLSMWQPASALPVSTRNTRGGSSGPREEDRKEVTLPQQYQQQGPQSNPRKPQPQANTLPSQRTSSHRSQDYFQRPTGGLPAETTTAQRLSSTTPPARQRHNSPPQRTAAAPPGSRGNAEDDDGYYYIVNDSDDEEDGGGNTEMDDESSLNSSFSDTGATGTSPKATAVRTSGGGERGGGPGGASPLDRAGGGSSPLRYTLLRRPKRPSKKAIDFQGDGEDNDGNDDNDNDDIEFNVANDYDEEDEEMAVQRYMDGGAAYRGLIRGTTAGDNADTYEDEEDEEKAKAERMLSRHPHQRRSKSGGDLLSRAKESSPAAGATVITPTPPLKAAPGTGSNGTNTASQHTPSTLSLLTFPTAPAAEAQRSSPPPLARPRAAGTNANQAYVQQQGSLGHVPVTPTSRGGPPQARQSPTRRYAKVADEQADQSTATQGGGGGGGGPALPFPVAPQRQERKRAASVSSTPMQSPELTPRRAALGDTAPTLSAGLPSQASPYGRVPTAAACQSLSLYEAFFLNESGTCWLVDDQVLAKCLDYVRLMGYQHPMREVDRAMGNVNSIWSSTAAIPSPLTRVVPEEEEGKAAEGGRVRPTFRLKRYPPACVANQLHLSSLFLSYAEAMRWIAEQEYVIGTILMCCTKADPSRRNSGRRHGSGSSVGGQEEQRRGSNANANANANEDAEHGRPAASHPGPESRNASSSPAPLGSVVDVDPSSAAGGRGAPPPRSTYAFPSAAPPPQQPLPVIPPNMHPIQWTAQYILTHFPHWGDFSSFARVWEAQTRLTLCTAAPSHQRVFLSRDDGLAFYSDFEGGNLQRVEKAVESYVYYIWLEPDCGCDKRIWFYFSIAGAQKGRTIRIRLLNAAPHTKLYRENGMSPVFRDGNTVPNWTPVDQCTFRTLNNEEDGEVSFAITARSSTDTIQVAFCVPYTYANLLCHFCHWHSLVRASVCSIRFEERVLCRTPDGRKQHLLIITSPTSNIKQRARTKGGSSSKEKRPPFSVNHDQGGEPSSIGGAMGSPIGGSGGKRKPGSGGGGDVVRGPYANFSSGKKVILISGRVHPGEITASHSTHGLISFLLSADPRAIQLREHFLFFIAPMLNPDGVSRGHSRLDQFGNNLNRCYKSPDPDTQPTVYALRKVFEHLQKTFRERFIMYLDFHSHASQSSGFMFGNHLPSSVHHWNLVYPKIVELHARESFSFGLCRFGRVHMVTKDGASRVLFGESLIHSYTVELPHFTDRQLYGDTFLALNNGGGVMDDEAATLAGGPVSSFSPPLTTADGKRYKERDDGGGEKHPRQGSHRGEGSGASQGRSASKATASGGKARTRAKSESAGVRGGNGKRSGKHSNQRGLSLCAADRNGTNTNGNNSGGNNGNDSSLSAVGPTGAVNGGGGASSAPTLSKRALRQLVQLSDRQSATLHPIALPSILSQSASVGRACALALLDYCAAGPKLSSELTTYGGMERVLVEVKRSIRLQAKAARRRAARRSRPSPTLEQPQGYQQLQLQLQQHEEQQSPLLLLQQQQQQAPPPPQLKDDFSSQPIFRQY